VNFNVLVIKLSTFRVRFSLICDQVTWLLIAVIDCSRLLRTRSDQVTWSLVMLNDVMLNPCAIPFSSIKRDHVELVA
jgi:hypothetical protein